MKPIVSFDDFAKLDFRVGLVTECEEKEGADKLLRLTVDFGEEGTRTILSGIKEWYKPEDIKGKLFIFVLNLEPRVIINEESQGMILAADPDSIGADGDKPYPLIPSGDVKPGTKIR